MDGYGSSYFKIPELEYRYTLKIWPIINHLHNDKENGQDYYHYHIDYRFIILDAKSSFAENYPRPKMITTGHLFAPHIRFDILGENKDYTIEYHPLKCIRHHNLAVAGIVNINKLKHKCIYKGKCPHRGYDLSREVPVNGIIECPLHGLKFDEKTKELIGIS